MVPARDLARLFPRMPGELPDLLAAVTGRTTHPGEAEALAATQDAKLARRPASRTAVERWFKARVETWPDDKPYPNEDQDLLAADSAGLGFVPRGMLRGIRADYAPPDWVRPGPRRARAAPDPTPERS